MKNPIDKLPKPKKRWNNRKIAFVAILIATSVSFVLIFNAFFPLTALPPFKLAAGGLPIKITGYIFGPIIGGITGGLSDLISFLFRPTFYHYWYTIAWIAAGVIPGIVGYLMNRRWKKTRVEDVEEQKHSVINFAITLSVLAAIFTGVFVWLSLTPSADFAAASHIISNKYAFMAVSLSGVASMFIAVIIFRFTLKAKTFNSLLPIIVFTALLEVVNAPLLGLGDQASLIDKPLLTTMTSHLLLSPVKIWGNMIIILIAYRVISPLIYNKTKNGWN